MLCLGKGLVVILNYALTAEQPDPCGPEPYSPGKRPRTHSPLGEGPVTPHIPGEVAHSQNSWGPRTSQGVPDPRRVPDPIYYPDPLEQGGTDTPPGAGPEPPRVHRCGHARGAAWLPLEDSPTYRIQCGRPKGALPRQSPRRLLPGCTVGRMLPRRTVQSPAPPTPRMSVYYASWSRRLGIAHYDAYTVASTDYAASYIAQRAPRRWDK